MTVRCAPIFSRAPVTLNVVLVIGIITALMAATIGLAQRDIKRILAYSTVSQLGYMFVSVGVGAFSAGIFHLMTHAFFKALLFLGAGSVIHALGGEQDLWRMGGLRKFTPITFWTMLIAALAISGIFPLAGFFSKDEILWSAWSGNHPFIWLLGFVTAGLTAFYMFRLIFLAFFGQSRISEEARHHLHESPFSMTVPLMVLGVLSIIGGFIGLPAWIGANQFSHFLEPSLSLAYIPEHPESSHSVEMGFAGLSILVALTGIFLAYRFYLSRPDAAHEIAARWKRIHRILLNKYYVDEFYDAAIVNPVLKVSTGSLWKRVDVGCIDGVVNGAGHTIQNLASVLKGVQNGLIRSYAAWIFFGVIAILIYFSLFRS
jgi:NADH-quinone oxidoreductase subunit L